MGKGTIISGGTNGYYQLQINYDNDQYDDLIAILNTSIAEYTIKITEKEGQITSKNAEITVKQAEIDALILAGDPWDAELKELNQLVLELSELTKQKSILSLRKMSFEKRKAFLIANMPSDPTVAAWCVDFTEDLSGIVGTIETPGYEYESSVLIKPGYTSAAWSANDKQLLPEISMSPHQSYFNRAVLPAVEKWAPRYRIGTITAIDGGLANITLDSATSSQQDLDINQSATLTGVPFEYMECDESAFMVGDSVLVQFTNQDWNDPKIIGFEDNPRPCCYIFIDVTTDLDLTLDNFVSKNKDTWDYWYPDENGDARQFYARNAYDGYTCPDYAFNNSGYKEITFRGGWVEPIWWFSYYPEYSSELRLYFYNTSAYIPIASFRAPDQINNPMECVPPPGLPGSKYSQITAYGHYASASSWSYTPTATYPGDNLRIDYTFEIIRYDFNWRPLIQLKASIISQIIKGKNTLAFTIVDKGGIFSGPYTAVHVSVTTVQQGELIDYWESSALGTHYIELPEDEDITDITIFQQEGVVKEVVSETALLEITNIRICY